MQKVLPQIGNGLKYSLCTVVGAFWLLGVGALGWHCNRGVIQPLIAFDKLTEISDRVRENYGETDGKPGISPTENYNLLSKIFSQHGTIYSHGGWPKYPDGRDVSIVDVKDWLVEYEKNHPIKNNK